MSETEPEPAEIPDSPSDIRWASLDQDGLCDVYWEHIAPTLETQGYDPEKHRPTHSWLREHGYRSLLYTLREHHDTTFSAFWTDVLGLEDGADGYDWGISHDETIELFEVFLESLDERRELSESSIQTIKYRLARYARAYADVNDDDDLITPVARDSDIPAYVAVDACWEAFDQLHEELDGGQTKRRIHEAVDSWYSHLVRRKRAALNPASGLDEEFKWSRDDSDNPRFSPEQVQALYSAAETTAERLIVIGLAAWGLRTSEVAALHQWQFVFDADDVPYISFDVRKNGPGEVSILYGEDVYQDRVVELGERESWNGYLFPSSGAESGHVGRQTILNWFDDLVAKADFPGEIEGEKPVPKMGRRFWYDAYSTVLDNVLEGLDEVAEEQGSKSAEVVLQEYLSDERNRELRREQMRQRLSTAFTSL